MPTGPPSFHRLLVALLKLAIQGDVLVDRQRFTAGMARDQLQFGVCKPRMLRQPRNRLMPERVRRGVHASTVGVVPDDLLDTPGRELRVAPSLEEVAVGWMGSDMRPQRRGEALAEEDVAILATLALVDPDLAGVQVHVGHQDVA